jgi:cell division protein FtsI (penicillin-binding protein 3)
MLSFYNAIANNGKYIAPIFVREIRRLGNTIERFETRAINEKICSDETLKKIQEMLEGVVSEGTGKGIIYNPLYKVAGKTGTAQVADGNKGYKAKRQYQASFCGYFPANKPKYSLIVVINDPKNGYYGAQVAGPPFREIADKVFASDLDIHPANAPLKLVGNTKMPAAKSGSKQAIRNVYKAMGVKTYLASNSNAIDTDKGIDYKDLIYADGLVPEVTGMGLKDALYVLGNAGLRAIVKGSGKVIMQSVDGGLRVKKGTPITIELN